MWIQLSYVNARNLTGSECKILLGVLRYEYIQNKSNILIYGNDAVRGRAKYMTRADMVKLSGLSRNTANTAIESLIDKGLFIKNVDKATHERYYHISPEIARAGKCHNDRLIPAPKRAINSE